VQTALRVRLEDDARELSMRRLAAALDVTPMALYRHFDDKDEILVAMADALLAAQELPPSETPWPEYLRALVVLLRRLLAAEPVVSTPEAEQIAGFVSEAQFFAGLDVILAGFAAQLASAASDG
jgi:AcrR family transcriptional regulator